MKCFSLALIAAPFLASLTASNDSPPPADPEQTVTGVSERLRRIVRAHDAGETQAALNELASLTKALDQLPDERRAEVHFARGIVVCETFEGEERLAATEDFFSARAFAGPGELRHAATYDAGLVQLWEGERWRSQIPEVGSANGMAPPMGGAGGPHALPGMPPPNAAGQGTPGEEEEPPDPLAEARAAYLRAREILCERLRIDWRDADTRANLELIQRRLKELDEIERQREEDQQQDENQEGEDGEESEDQEGEDEENEEQDGDSEEQDEGSEDGEDESEEEQEPGEEEQENEDEDSPGEEGEEEEIEAPQPEEGEEQEVPAGEPEETERHLTREEVMRILDQLAEIEEEARAKQARAARARRENVEKDW